MILKIEKKKMGPIPKLQSCKCIWADDVLGSWRVGWELMVGPSDVHKVKMTPSLRKNLAAAHTNKRKKC